MPGGYESRMRGNGVPAVVIGISQESLDDFNSLSQTDARLIILCISIPHGLYLEILGAIKGSERWWYTIICTMLRSVNTLTSCR